MRDAAHLGLTFLDAYRHGLAAGKPRWIERTLAEGLIKKLLQDLKKTERRKFLDKRSTRKRGQRRLHVDGKRALLTKSPEKKQVALEIARYAKTQADPGFFRVLDVVDRIAGTGSLGVKRYSILVEGRGSPDGNFLLDLKEALPSATAGQGRVQQPAWASEAERVVTLQKSIEAIAPALLTPLIMGGRPYVLKELQPLEQRVDLASWKGKRARLETLLQDMGQLTAWAQLRAAGWRGSADRDALGTLGASSGWTSEVLEASRQRSRLLRSWWMEYCAAYDKGAFKIKT